MDNYLMSQGMNKGKKKVFNRISRSFLGEKATFHQPSQPQGEKIERFSRDAARCQQTQRIKSPNARARDTTKREP